MATSIILKFLTLKCDISRTIWHIEVSDGSLFCIFHALSLELNLFFDRTCPLTVLSKYHHFMPEPHFQTVESRTIPVLFKRANDEITAETGRKGKRIVLGLCSEDTYSFEN